MRVKAMRSAVFFGALAALAACDAERILAITRDATGNPSDAGGDVSMTDGNPGDGGQSGTPFGPAQPVTGLRSDSDEVQDPSLTFEETENLLFVPHRRPERHLGQSPGGRQ